MNRSYLKPEQPEKRGKRLFYAFSGSWPTAASGIAGMRQTADPQALRESRDAGAGAIRSVYRRGYSMQEKTLRMLIESWCVRQPHRIADGADFMWTSEAGRQVQPVSATLHLFTTTWAVSDALSNTGILHSRPAGRVVALLAKE